MRKLLVAGLLLAAACSNGKSAVEVISGAPAAAAAKRSAKVSIETIVKLSGQGQTFATVTRGEGVSQLGGSHNGHMTLTVATSPSPRGALEPCEMISTGSLVYARLPHTQRWVSVDIAKVAGIDPSALSADPSAQLDYLKSVSGTVKTVGHEKVRGTSTTHYRYTLNVDQFLSKLKPATRQQMQAALKELEISSFPLDTWIDDDGLPRRVSFDWKTTKQGATFEMNTRIETYDYGTNVTVAPPPANRVTQASNPATAFAQCFGAPAGSIGGVPQK